MVIIPFTTVDVMITVNLVRPSELSCPPDPEAQCHRLRVSFRR
uniref:Uncharacterized protein n=1 Tax=Rhizophora mucronata TaxID=61149 RepID=A0A2P2P911_RHIMU